MITRFCLTIASRLTSNHSHCYLFERRRFEDKSRECPDPDKLKSFSACLSVKNDLNVSIALMKVHTECYKCNLMEWYGPLGAKTEFELSVDPQSVIFGFNSNLGSSCNITYTFKEHGKYEWIADFNCQSVKVVTPGNFGDGLLPVYVIHGTVLMVFIFYKILKIMAKHVGIDLKDIKKFRKRKKGKDEEIQSTFSKATTATTATSQTSGGSRGFPVPQVLAFQVFRGLTMLMIVGILHGECSRLWIYQESYWNGIKLADFLFPWWYWNMGNVMYLKYQASFLLGESKLTLYWKIVKKSMVYIILGYCLNTFEDYQLQTSRFPGPLQRYGALHLVWFLLEVSFMRAERKEGHIAQDLRENWPQAAFALGSVLLHLLLTFLVPVPDCPLGYLGPGGLHMYSAYENCTGGSARLIDSYVFGDDHMDPYNNARALYASNMQFDNEGIVGTLSAVLTVYGGIQAARIFIYYSQLKTQILHLVTWGIVQILLGLCLCGFSKEEGLIPLNHHLYSVSFALLSSGTAFLIFTVLFYIVDVRGWWSGSPCFESGLNSMMIFAGSWVFRYSLPFSWNRVYEISTAEFVIMDLITVMFWIKVAIYCFKCNRIFLV